MKLALGIEYDGSLYFGWERQKNFPSIRSCLEYAISIVANESITTYCAGRTDAGVHSIGQVVHFETYAKRSSTSWIAGINRYLPKDISVKWVVNISEDFHARFSAKAREYRYIVYNNPLRPSILYYKVTHHIDKLDVINMLKASKFLLGFHNFKSFQSSQCRSYNAFREIYSIKINRFGNYIIFDIKANSFLHHMVRNIIGSLLCIGSGKKPYYWMKELLNIKNRNKAGATANANGLYLLKVYYPKSFKLP